MTTTTTTVAVVPTNFRFQVAFEFQPELKTIEFGVGDLDNHEEAHVEDHGGSVLITLDDLTKHIVRLWKAKTGVESEANCNGDQDDINNNKAGAVLSLQYRIHEPHESRWVLLQSTKSLEFAMELNKDRGYLYLLASSSASKKKTTTVTRKSTKNKTAAKKGKNTVTTTKHNNTLSSLRRPLPRRRYNKTGSPFEETILTIMVELRRNIHLHNIPRTILAKLTGYSLFTKKFANTMTLLRENEFVTFISDPYSSFALTALGLEKAKPSFLLRTPPKSNEELHNWIKNDILDKITKNSNKSGGLAIFDVLSDGQFYTEQELIQKIEGGSTSTNTSPSIKNNISESLSTMKEMGVVEYRNSLENILVVGLTDVIFPFGRPTAGNSTTTTTTTTTDLAPRKEVAI